VWKKPRKDVPATFNARAETDVRGVFKYRRCIIPASGFYEWTCGKNARQPHLFTAADGGPVLEFAGLWDRWIGFRGF
jgi:putative SOS response-associated peptidase YedK